MVNIHVYDTASMFMCDFITQYKQFNGNEKPSRVGLITLHHGWWNLWAAKEELLSRT